VLSYKRRNHEKNVKYLFSDIISREFYLYVLCKYFHFDISWDLALDYVYIYILYAIRICRYKGENFANPKPQN